MAYPTTISKSTPSARSGAEKKLNPPKQTTEDDSDSDSDYSYHSDSSSSTSSRSKAYNSKKRTLPSALPHQSQYVALDCEMVGTLTGMSLCARVVLVDWKGKTIFDTFVAPSSSEIITDYRTFVSGVTAEDLVDAPAFESVQAQVLELLKGKILVGHALVNDLKCLKIQHPWHKIRDTATYAPFQRRQGDRMLPRKLKDLVYEKLDGEVIQQPGKAHSPAEDAIAALDLYKKHRPRWEAVLAKEVQKQQKQYAQELREQQDYYYWCQFMWQQQQQQQQQQMAIQQVEPLYYANPVYTVGVSY